jgi:hypothetical protein
LGFFIHNTCFLRVIVVTTTLRRASMIDFKRFLTMDINETTEKSQLREEDRYEFHLRQQN